MQISSEPVLAVALIMLASCAVSDADRSPAFDGVIAEMNEGIRKLTPREQERVCPTQLCEPNYLYTASFGKKRPSPDPVAPAPASAGETTDYSRAILRLPESWQITQGSRDVVVAVIDTGIDTQHPDLKDNLWVNPSELGGQPFFDDDHNGFVDDIFGFDFYHNHGSALDDNRHGTHVSGIIGAELNGLGTIGVSPKVRILPLKFLNSDGVGDTENAIRAFNYAIDHGAHIISNSWGGGGYSQLMDQVVQRAVSRGILVVAAAGNEARDNGAYASYPANYLNVISVASSDESDALSSFSNYGVRAVTLAAPGSRILSSVPGGGYQVLSGTSMAAPQVSGALALALSLNPAIERARLTRALCDSSDKILVDRVTCGRLDALRLLQTVHP